MLSIARALVGALSVSIISTIAGTAEQSATPLPTIEVTAAKDVASVRAIDSALAGFSEKVTACAKTGRALEDCQCSDPQDLTRLRRGYEALIKQHPEWKDKLLSYRYLNEEGRNVSGTLVLQTLRRQLEALKC
jgi:hypothetical protein